MAEEKTIRTVSVKEAAHILNVSRTYVYRLIHDGRLTIKDGEITLESVLDHNRNKKPRGRPSGTFKY